MIREHGGFTAAQMQTPEAQAVIRETAAVLSQAIDSSIPQDTPAEVRYALENNAFIFSGFKTFHSLREVGLSLTDSKGNIKPFEQFMNDVQTISQAYNRNYLYAEYNHAVSASQMAEKWQHFMEDGDDYDLQYRTAKDDRVREAHRLLDGTTLPPSDPFWEQYLPPNGWNCRCTAVQVRRGKYPLSDSALAIERGNNSTASIAQQIFRYNPGTRLELFPPKHPYYKAPASASTVIKKAVAKIKGQTREEQIAGELGGNLTEDEKKAIAKNCVEIEKALKIKKGKPMTVEEADKQSANPKYQDKFIEDPNGSYYGRDGKRYSINPQYAKATAYSVNCATCSCAYALRMMGFDVTAKGNKSGSGSLNERISIGEHWYEMWKEIDGSSAFPTRTIDWMRANGYSEMTESRYQKFFEETCKEEGVYILSIGWKGKRFSGHATILQRDEKGNLFRVEPQSYDPNQGAKRTIKSLCVDGTKRPSNCRGIIRVDNKIFDSSYATLFDT